VVLSVCLVLTFIATTHPAELETDSTPIKKPIGIAVIPLQNLDQPDTFTGTELWFHESLTWSLKHVPNVAAFELKDLVEAAKQSPEKLASTKPTDLMGLGRKLGVSSLIGGSYRETRDQLVVTLFVVDIPHDSIITLPAFVTPKARLAADAVKAVDDFGLFEQPLPAQDFGSFSSTLALWSEGVGVAARVSLGAGLQNLQKATALFRKAVSGEPHIAEVWYRLGETLVLMADYEEARSALKEALKLARTRKDRALERTILLQMADSHILQGHGLEAKPYYVEALSALEKNDFVGKAMVRNGLAAVYHQQGNHEEAEKSLDLALDMWKAIGNSRYQAKTLNHKGVLKIIAGEYQLARKYFAEAEDIVRIVGDRSLERSIYDNLGTISLRTGAYQEALSRYESARRIAHEMGDQRGEALELRSLGLLKGMIGMYAAAQSDLQGALEKARAIHAEIVEIDILAYLGWVQFMQGDYHSASTSYKEGLRLARQLKIPLQEGRMLNHLGQVFQAQGNGEEAERYQQAALQISRTIGDRRLAAFSLYNLGEIFFSRQDYSASLAHLEESRQVAVQVGLTDVVWRNLHRIGLVYERRSREGEALEQYRKAVAILGDLSGQFQDEQGRQVFLRDKLVVYDDLARLLLKLHQSDAGRGYEREAWAVLDAKKNRLVADAFRGIRLVIRDPEARADAEKAQATLDKAIAIERALRNEQAKSSQNPERLEKLTTLVANTKAEYFAQVQAFEGNPKYEKYRAQFSKQNAVNLSTLAKFVGQLTEDMLAVQYFAAPDQLYIFIVESGGKYRVKTQTITQEDLYALIRQYRKYIELGTNTRLSWDDNGSETYTRDVLPLKELTDILSVHLLAPIEKELQAHRNVLLIPNDLLLHLPIHALTRRQPDGSARFLAETHLVSYTTQLELANVAQRLSSSDSSLLAFANPDGSLQGATVEVEELLKIRSKSKGLNGPQATKAQFMALAPLFKDLHLATHGVLDPDRPERSYLLMAGDDESSRRLTLGEIRGVELRNGLAILSACNTAVTEQVPGAALITLAAAFSQAGSRAILASLWEVDDASTSKLMVTFHRGLPSVGNVAALQQAQLSISQSPRTAHPFYWAGFILFGGR